MGDLNNITFSVFQMTVSRNLLDLFNYTLILAFRMLVSRQFLNVKLCQVSKESQRVIGKHVLISHGIQMTHSPSFSGQDRNTCVKKGYLIIRVAILVTAQVVVGAIKLTMSKDEYIIKRIRQLPCSQYG